MGTAVVTGLQAAARAACHCTTICMAIANTA